MDCYKVLGIAENADQKEIKRAYFRLVRQFSPENDPDRFQEIRAAYEMLTSGEATEIIDSSLEFPTDLLAKQMRNFCREKIDAHEYKGAMAVAEEALERFGETEGFLYFLAYSQLHAGNTGKAVKNFERLVFLYPQKTGFQRELAMAYQERGYGNKAYQAFQMAYDSGCRDNEFLMRFSVCCSDRDQPEQGIRLLVELLSNLRPNLKEHMEEAMNAFYGMLTMGRAVSRELFSEVLGCFRDFIHSASPYLSEYEQEVMTLAAFFAKGAYDCIWDIFEVRKTLAEIKTYVSGDLAQEGWEIIEKLLEDCAIQEDERLSELMKRGYEAFVVAVEEVDSWMIRYMQLDTELCIMEEWPGIRSQVEIIREEYPCYYKMIHDFIQKLESTSNIEQLRERLQNDYDRREKNIGEGYYYREYPHRRRSKSEVRWDSDEGGTYVRSQPKIGRNDPCPCGSGKKYKNCCGKGK